MVYERQFASGSAETVDLADVVRTLRRQWRAVLAFLALGVLGAAAVVLFAPRRFEGKASVLARSGSSSGTSIAGRITGLSDILGGFSSLGGGSIETELQVLRSRALAGQVVDSLQLQVAVREPAGIAPVALVESADLDGSFAPHEYDFERVASGAYQAKVGDKTYELAPGRAGQLNAGTITLRAGPLPDRFTVRLMDREDAIDRFTRRLTVTKAGGDIAKLTLRGDDSLTAAASTNALVKFYLDRRKTTDRGVNERKVEYVTAQLDSVGADLTRTESELRRYQESSRVLDAEVVGKVELETAAQLRRVLTDLQVDEAAISQLLSQVEGGGVTSRDLAAYPSFLRGSSVSPMVMQLSELEAQRIRMLERRTEQDPEVRAIDETMKLVQGNIVSMARSYANAITRQREQFQTRIDSVQKKLLALPAAQERGGRLQRDVERLTAIYAALEAQLVEARLGAIGEGGETRQLDVAVPQRKPAFPQPMLTMGIGTVGGLLAGVVAALFLGWFGRWLRDPVEIERALGVMAQRIEADSPLLLANVATARSLLIVPLDQRAQSGAALVAERLARTARQRSLSATVLDLSSSHVSGNGKGTVDSEQLGSAIDKLEQDNGIAIVQLPQLTSDVTLAVLRETRPVLLVAPPGPVERSRLGHAVDTLRRLQIPCAGVVISDGPAHLGSAISSTVARALR
jgi:uncharacterized protein involved in exopolysaccharide biosynthesis